MLVSLKIKIRIKLWWKTELTAKGLNYWEEVTWKSIDDSNKLVRMEINQDGITLLSYKGSVAFGVLGG